VNDKVLQIEHLGDEIIKGGKLNEGHNGKILTLKEKKAFIELEEIEKALEKANGKKTNAAKSLGINLDKLRYKVEKNIEKNRDLVKGFNNIKKAYNTLLK